MQIDIDVRQSPSGRDSAGYPLVWRDITTSTVHDLAGVAAGARSLHVGGDVLGADHRLVGRWLRFADVNGKPERHGYKISSTRDGGGGDDILTIGDVRGFVHPHPAGRAVWIDYGWSPGDSFYSWAPLRINSATASELDSQVRLAGSVAVQWCCSMASAQQQRPGGERRCSSQPTVQVGIFEDVWIADP